MEGFKATYINEVERMLKRKKAVVTVILSLLVIIAGQVLFSSLRNGLGIRIGNSTEFSLSVLSVLSVYILPLFASLLAIDIFAGEYSQNTMKILVFRPVSRFGIFLAKIAAIATFVIANIVLVMLLSIIVGSIFNNVDFSALNFARILIAYAVTILPVMTLVLFIVLLSNILKNGAAVFFLTILAFIALKVLSIVFSDYSGIMLVSQLDWYGKFIHDTVAFDVILRQFLIMLGYGIIFFTSGFYLFDKKDL